MKKIGFISLALMLMMALSACGGPSEEVDEAPPTEPSAAEHTYKETMVPFDQLVYSDRIVILQNALNYTADGFYTQDTQPVSEQIEYEGETVQAYPLTYALDFLNEGCEGAVAITKIDGSQTELEAEVLKGMYVMLDFSSSDAPVFYHPETKDEINDFAYAITSEGEAIYSIVSASTHKGKDILEACGWDTSATCRYVATDKFYIPVPAAENATGELRGTLSGAINGSFPDLTIASGKINDVMYIEAIVE